MPIPHIFWRMHAPTHLRPCFQHICTHTRSHAPSIPQQTFCCFLCLSLLLVISLCFLLYVLKYISWLISTLRLLVRGDPQDEGLRRLQPRARLSKLDILLRGDYFYVRITSTRGLLLRAMHEVRRVGAIHLKVRMGSEEGFQQGVFRQGFLEAR